MTPSREFVADGAGVRVGVTEVGTGPAIMLQHGVASSRDFIVEAFAGPLTDAGWRLLAVDIRGHGDCEPVSEVASFDVDELVADVRQLAGDLEPRVVGGVSLGGHVAACAVAGGLSVDALAVCLPAWTGTIALGVGPHAVIAERVGTVGVPAMIEELRANTEMPNWLRQRLVRDWQASDPASVAAALRSLDGGRAPTEVELSALDVPLALVGWPDDPGHPLAVARHWAAEAPRAELRGISIEGAIPSRSVFGTALVDALKALGVTPETLA